MYGRPEGKRPLGTPSRRWEDNIEMDIQEATLRGRGGGQGLDGRGGGWEGEAGACERGNEDSGSVKCGKFLD